MEEKKHNYFYKITNLVNGKYYYGIRSCDKLPDSKYMGSGMAIEAAVKKYKRKNFTKEIIANYPTRKEASDHEKMVVTIDLVNLAECYNLRTGGDNEYTPSEETKKKLSEFNKGKKHTNESRKKMSVSQTGRKHTENTKSKMREISSGRTHTNETKEKMSKIYLEKYIKEKHPNWGKNLSEETKQKISESNKGKKQSEETCAKMSKAKTGEGNSMYGKRQTLSSIVKNKESQPNRLSCNINGVCYVSIKEAARQLKISPKTVKKYIESEHVNWSDWSFADSRRII